MKHNPAVHLLAFEGMPIFEQLQLEEALLRIGQDNYCLLNHKSTPAIVMGISGKVDELVDQKHYKKQPVPIIRRFSGGGCVLVGQETLFLTFIFNRSDIDIGTCPQKLLEWTGKLLQPVFGTTHFRVRENDYVLGEKKFGGNAQYFTKDRWLHHTSLLWDYSADEMKILKMPPKMPSYRQMRDHGHFLCRLNEHFKSKQDVFDGVIESISQQCQVIHKTAEEVKPFQLIPHRKATEHVVLLDNDSNK